MLEALVDRAIEPDLVVGSSVGAINGVYYAAHPGPDGVRSLRQIWMRVGRGDVFPVRLLGGILSLLSLRNHVVDPGPLERLIRRNLGVARLEDTRIPVHVVATDILTGEEVVLSSGSAASTLLASAAIPGVFPPVRIDGRHLADGGIASNTPISAAVERGAERVIVLPTGFSCEAERPPENPIAMALHGLNLLISRQLVVDVERFENRAEIRIVPPLCPLPISSFDFSQAQALMERASRSTRAWLEGGGLERPAEPEALRPHTHGGR